MEKADADLVTVTITEKKRVLVQKKRPDDPDVWTYIDKPRLLVYVNREDLSLFMEEMYLFRSCNLIGIQPNYSEKNSNSKS